MLNPGITVVFPKHTVTVHDWSMDSLNVTTVHFSYI